MTSLSYDCKFISWKLIIKKTNSNGKWKPYLFDEFNQTAIFTVFFFVFFDDPYSKEVIELDVVLNDLDTCRGT